MLTEGKEQLFTYVVIYSDRIIGHNFARVLANNAQLAVDYVRKYKLPDGEQIMSVAKVVRNWK